MLEQLTITNFRSIRSDTISLQPITVLIGANGSGKSNLVKAIQFLSDILRFGISGAASQHGGADAMVPKSVPTTSINKTITEFTYRARLVSPIETTDDEDPPLTVEHSIRFRFSHKKNEVRVLAESLTHGQVLYVSELLRGKKGVSDIPRTSVTHPSKPSTFSIQKSERGASSFVADPPIGPETIDHYIRWLGLSVLKEKITTKDEFEKTLGSLWEHRHRGTGRGQRGHEYTFLDPSVRTILDFSVQSHVFEQSQKSIRRYDLLLNELRKEQKPSDSRSLSGSGDNMPGILGWVMRTRGSRGRSSWKRLYDTFHNIAPHIAKMQPASLRTGKQFIEFIESKAGRGVESWESSDGSLRALAILLAVETADAGSTIIIEEPEQNLHPWAVRILVDHIREVVEEREIQVILTTHSEHVLDRTKPEEVRVATRTLKEGTKFRRITDVAPGVVEMGEVGRLWVKGLLGGVPSEQ